VATGFSVIMDIAINGKHEIAGFALTAEHAAANSLADRPPDQT
jgi:hypothetical protein